MTNKTLENKTVWVTGSSRGLGRVIADHLASLGAWVAVHGTTPLSARALNEGESLAAVAQTIAQAHGVPALPVYGDLSNPDVVQQIVAEIHQAWGRIDILVNCAGGDIGAQGVGAPQAGKPQDNDAIHISLADMRTVLDRNLMTCILTCREVVPEMIERRSGCIVNIGSIAGLGGGAREAIYATAKAAVHEYTRCLAAMLRPYNIRANVVAPGPTVTPRFLASRPADPAMMITQGTLERYSQPIEVAQAVAFLVGDAGSFIHGQVLRVDGGLQLWPA